MTPRLFAAAAYGVLALGIALSAATAMWTANLIEREARHKFKVALAESITDDLRHIEARLSAAQRMAQELIEVLPNPIFYKDTDGRYLGVNRA